MMAAKEIIEYLFKGNPTDLLNATRKVEGGLKGVDDQADKTAAGVNQSFSKMASNFKNVGDKMQRTGAVLTAGVTVPLAIALKGMADAAVQDQAALGKLEGQLKRTTGATRDQLDQVNEYIDKTSVAVGVADDQLRPAFERLARASGSTEQAQKDLNLALDVSRATGKDLETVAQAMGRAYDGSTGALGRLGVATKDAAGNTLDLKTIMENMNRQFGGAANDWANTAAGKAEIARIRFDELKEQIGANLVPVMEDLADIASTVIKFFAEMPDWAQKASVGIGLLSGPLTAVGGTLLKFVGDWKNRQAIIAAVAGDTADQVGAAGKRGGEQFAGGMQTGAKKSAGIFGAVFKGLGITALVAGVVYATDRAVQNMKKYEDANKASFRNIEERGNAFLTWQDDWVTKAEGNLQKYLGTEERVSSVQRRLGEDAKSDIDVKRQQADEYRKFFDLLDQARSKGEVYATAADKVAGSNINVKDGITQLNEVLKSTPGQLDPTISKTEELARQAGMSADQIERIKETLSDLTAFINYEQAVLKTKDSITDMIQTLIDIGSEQSQGGVKMVQSEIDDLYDSALSAAGALENELRVGLETGRISAKEAADRIAAFDRNLVGVKEQAPLAAAQIDALRQNIDNVKSKSVNIWVETGNAKRAIDSFKSYMARTLSSGNLNFWSLTRGVNMLAGNEAGGMIPFARGGVYMANSGGGITTGPMAVIGEGREPREYVIPTDARYRDRALSLMNQAASELGVGVRPSMSSSFTANINVSGGSDPQATAAAVADAVEQAFARKKRREGSLAFT